MDDLRERVEAVEQALTDGDGDLTALAAGAASPDRIDSLEAELGTLQEDVAELEAATQALRGYVGSVRSVNESVEERADAALAAVEALFGLFDGPEKTTVRSAAQVLAVAGDAGFEEANIRAGDGLHRDVTNAAWWLEQSMKQVLARHGLGPEAVRNRTVESALDRWETPAARAAALANGSAGAAVYAEAIDRWPDALDSTRERELLAIDLESAAHRARSVDAYQPRESVVREAATSIRGMLGSAGRASSDGLQSLSAERIAEMAARLPGGVPVLPAPGFWYAMVNAWHVQVRGSYVRFVVSVPRGAPDRLPADLQYVRENRRVRLDADGDGTAELLGRNRRITFAAETVVGVAVPPKPRGVGDVGERDEQSPGWPTPGPVDRGN